tara:strand:+ start:225 stop:368 length:144 start_codon:yes stop_codon:yes gene_type:complete
MNFDEEIKKYEMEAEKLKGMMIQCLGVVSYLKQQKENENKKDAKDKK